MSYILIIFYATMAAAGYVIEFLFAARGIIPQNRNVVAISEGIQWNYITVLNIVFLALAAVLLIRFLRTGGVAMLKRKAGKSWHHFKNKKRPGANSDFSSSRVRLDLRDEERYNKPA